MAKGAGYTDSFYAGTDYGFDSNYGKEFSLGFSPEYQFPVSQFGVTTDPRTSNQLKEVSGKLNTGAKTVEIEGLQPSELESIPDQHFTEINRLKKLVGVDLTFHGPLVEPTGVTKQGWNESHREQAERQMWSAVNRAHKIDPDGNIVITFHSSNGLPDPVTKAIDEKTGNEQIKEFWVVDKSTGQFQAITPKPDYFKSKEKMNGGIKEQEEGLRETIDTQNKDLWFRSLQGVSFHAHQGASSINEVLSGKGLSEEDKSKFDDKTILEFYKDYLAGGEATEAIRRDKGVSKQLVQSQMNALTHGDIYLRDAYQDLQKLFNQAYDVAVKNNKQGDIEKLDEFRAKMKSKVTDIEDPSKMSEFSSEIIRGVNTLRAIAPPESLKPLREFGVDKASDTFSNLAFNAYKKFGDTAPIISVENPPAGMGLTRAEDLRDIIEVSRDKLKQKLMEKQNLSSWAAGKQADKLIGVTWDVGHINMIKKFGYDDKALVRETEIVAPLVKHVHLSDNFGMEHTELPMGMGNVPTKPMLEAIHKFNKKAKKIIETGGAWFRDFKISPLKQSLQAFGSPIYSMKMAPHWNRVSDASGGYFSGYGQVLPEQHFSMYGAGFSNLPPELGGQMSGRSRMSGAPIE